MRNMSFSATKKQFRARTKTETRRMGWIDAVPGQVVMGVEKAQGLRKGEKVVQLGPILFTLVERQPLNAITPEQVIAEGFPDQTPEQFIAFFCQFNACTPETEITRIVFEYLTAIPEASHAAPTAAPDDTEPAAPHAKPARYRSTFVLRKQLERRRFEQMPQKWQPHPRVLFGSKNAQRHPPTHGAPWEKE